MQNPEYQWQSAMTLQSGGYNGESISIERNGVVVFSGSVNKSELPKTFGLGWNTTSTPTGSEEITYTYRDSDSSNNNNSTKVEVTIRDEWTISFDDRNNMIVQVATTLVSAVRTKIGSPSNINRHLWMRRTKNGSDFSPFPLIDNASTAHTIASNVSLGTETFTLAPGGTAERSTIYWRNTSVGYESWAIPNIYTDIINMGVHFKNILPPDYVPGKVRNNNDDKWYSCNRHGGTAKIRKLDGTWKQMRTINGPNGTDNPPYINHSDDEFHNQRLIGYGA